MTDQQLRVAIVGGGAMGSIYASLLAPSRHTVWLIDVWREHIESIRQDIPVSCAYVPMHEAQAEHGLIRSRSVAPPPTPDALGSGSMIFT